MARRAVAVAACAGALAVIVSCTDLGDLSGTQTALPEAGAPDGPTTTNEAGLPPEDGGCNGPVADPANLGDVVEIGAGGLFSCALRAGGQVVCWGDNSRGQLGTSPTDGGTNYAMRPAAVPKLPPATRLSLGYSHGCALATSSEVWCWGDFTDGRTGYTESSYEAHVVVDENNKPFKAVGLASGGTMTCALVAGGSVWCWGSNAKGQLGTPYGSYVPSLVTLAGSATEVVAGAFHACAMTGTAAAPEVRCWGENKDGALGLPMNALDGGFTSTPTIYPTGNIKPVRILAGLNSTCVLDSNGAPTCSGYTYDGALGTTLASPTRIFNPTPIPELAAGGIRAMDTQPAHSCGVKNDDTAFCLGVGVPESLGRGPIDAGDNDPGPVSNPTGTGPLAPVAMVRAGGSYSNVAHACALVKPACAATGTVYCWGTNATGQLGDGTTTTRDRPVAVLAPL